MKKLIPLLLLFFALKASAQLAPQTYWTPGVPPGSTSFTPTLRFNGTDSLANMYISNANRWNQFYTGTQQNLRFLQKADSAHYVTPSALKTRISVINRTFSAVSNITVNWQTDYAYGTVTYAQLLGNKIVKRPSVYMQTTNMDGTYSYQIIDYNLTITQSADQTQILTLSINWIIPLTGVVSF